MDNRLKRGAGILLPITSLPSNYGIGTIGRQAYKFIDQLRSAGQSYWQILPVGHTSYGDSPYQSFSAFAGNPYLIDLDMLIEEGILHLDEVIKYEWNSKQDYISYEILWEQRYKILNIAFMRSKHRSEKEYIKFLKENKFWLEDYALFMACKEYFDNKAWFKWDKEIRMKTKVGVRIYSEKLSIIIEFWKFVQYKFYQQWKKLKKYANENNIQIVGDIPIYVAMDSVDIWSNPKQYQLNDKLEALNVAGCPPDGFSEYGQKWGNPLYDWDEMNKDNYAWWQKRIKVSAKLYDVIRIDHFIGIVRYYSVPIDKDARYGEFHKGPGLELIKAIDKARGSLKIIAEDLGITTKEVYNVLNKAGYPGMKVIEFAFDKDPLNIHLPYNCVKNCVVYSGTHDNETLKGYFETLNKEYITYMKDYFNIKNDSDIIKSVIRGIYASVADTVIIQMQDILEKDNTSRMNLPGTIGENWRWRLKDGEFTKEHMNYLLQMSKLYGRTNARNVS